jgi:tetratricopeptide (TPR) repeat protein
VIKLETRISSAPTSNLAAYHNNLGNVLRDAGRGGEAVPHFVESIRIQDAVLPAGHPNRAFPRMALAATYLAAHRYASAEPLLREAVAVRRKALAPRHRDLGDALSALGECLTGLRRFAEADAVLAEALEILVAADGPDGNRTRRTRERIAQLHAAKNTQE